MRKHRTPHHITYRVDTRNIGLALVIHCHKATLVQVNTRIGGEKLLGVRGPTHRNDQFVAFDLLFVAVAVFIGDIHQIALDLSLVTRHFSRMSSPCFLKLLKASLAIP